eukprot:scaffold23126_cov241-Isochrysis_galbana.AAC.8
MYRSRRRDDALSCHVYIVAERPVSSHVLFMPLSQPSSPAPISDLARPPKCPLLATGDGGGRSPP